MGNLQNIELVPQPQTFLVLVEIIALCTHTISMYVICRLNIEQYIYLINAVFLTIRFMKVVMIFFLNKTLKPQIYKQYLHSAQNGHPQIGLDV